MQTLIRDFRFVFRSLLKSPVFTLVAVISLSLGVGANTAIFTLVDQVLLRMLPVQHPEEMMMIASRGSHSGSNRGSNSISYPMFKDYREKNEVFSGVMARRAEIVNLTAEGGSPERAEAEMVSGNYFEVLGIRPALGRLFSMSDETARNANPVIVLAHDYWRNHFDSDSGIVGKTVRINEHPMTVVGVAPPGFTGVSLGFQPDLFVPVTMQPWVTPGTDDLDDRRTRFLQLYARLRPGVTRERAEAQIRTLYKQIIAEEVKQPAFANVPEYARNRFLESYAVVLPGAQGHSGMRNRMERPLQVLLGLVVFLLLITCVNVSNLLVARGAARQKEISVRLALGAGRRRILGHLLSESVVLALISGLLALPIAFLTVKGLLVLAPTDEVRMALSATPDLRVLLFNFLASLVAALLFGLTPAWQASRTSVSSVLKDQAGSISGGGTRLRKVLVVAQVALCFLLLIGSGLFVQSLGNLKSLDPGFEAGNLIRFKINPTLSGYNPERTKAFYWELQQRLERTPGVEAVGLAVVPIMEGDEWDSTVKVEGYKSEDGENMNPHFNSVSPGYFKALNIPIKAGRDFEEKDFTSPTKVGIVNETFAKRYFKDRNPVGYHFGFGGGSTSPPDVEIIAVVGDAKYEDLDNEIPRQVFVLNQQQEWAIQMTGYVRTSRPSSEAFATVRKTAAEMDPTLPLFDMNTMEDQLDRSLSLERLVAFLSAAFGILATVLCVIGLYGVTAYTVARRMREFGILMAFGAQSGDVIGKVLKECATLAAIGVTIGLPLVWWLSEMVESQLFGVEARDPITYGGVAALLLAVAAIAGIMPAWRASRVSPWIVLRYE